MKNENILKDLHLYKDEETTQKILHYLEIHDPKNTIERIHNLTSKIHAAFCACR